MTRMDGVFRLASNAAPRLGLITDDVGEVSYYGADSELFGRDHSEIPWCATRGIRGTVDHTFQSAPELGRACKHRCWGPSREVGGFLY